IQLIILTAHRHMSDGTFFCLLPTLIRSILIVFHRIRRPTVAANLRADGAGSGGLIVVLIALATDRNNRVDRIAAVALLGCVGTIGIFLAFVHSAEILLHHTRLLLQLGSQQ